MLRDAASEAFEQHGGGVHCDWRLGSPASARRCCLLTTMWRALDGCTQEHKVTGGDLGLIVDVSAIKQDIVDGNHKGSCETDERCPLYIADTGCWDEV